MSCSCFEAGRNELCPEHGSLAGIEVQFTVLDQASGALTCGSCGTDIAEGQQTCACGACFVGDLASEPDEVVYGDFQSFFSVIE